MAEDELATFRKRWKEELKCKKEEQRVVGASSPSWDAPGRSGQEKVKNRYFEDSKGNLNTTHNYDKTGGGGCVEDEGYVDEKRGRGNTGSESGHQPEYVAIAHSLLDGRTSPLLDRIQEERTRRKRQYNNLTDAGSKNLQQQQQEEQPRQRKVKTDEKLLDQFIRDLVR